MKVFQYIRFVAWALVLSSTPLYADAPSGFFSKDGPRGIFTTRMQVKDAEEYVILPAKQVVPAAAQQEAPAAIKPEAKESTVYGDQELPLNERLEKEFGDPLEPFKVEAIDSAPAPYKGMLVALREGDKELAFKYAVQYVKYKRDLREMNSKITSLIGQGLVRIGELSDESWPSQPTYQEDWYLRDLELGNEEELEVEKPSSRNLSVDDEAKELLARAKDSQFALFNDQRIKKIDSEALQLDEAEERRRVQQTIARKLPRDPKGKIDVYFFFSPTDQVAQGIAADIEKLYKETEKSEDSTFLAFTLDKYDSADVTRFSSDTKTTFPIVAGSELATKLDVKKSPSVLFFTPTTGASHIEEGVRSFYFLDEIAKIMGGKK